MEYSGPITSTLSRRPGPTKLHEVVASVMSGRPSSSSYATVARAKSSTGARR